MRTAIATMASINSKSRVIPSDTESESTGVIIKGIRIERKGRGEYTFNDFNDINKSTGFNYYRFSSEAELLYAINYELNHGRSVAVKTQTSTRQHWVTITGRGSSIGDAKSFAQLKGIDPWYNGFAPPNPNEGTGASSMLPEHSNITNLSEAHRGTQKFHGDYAIMTINVD